MSKNEVKAIKIRGVEYNTDLTELVLSDTALTNDDIKPLIHMTNLQKLVLPRKEISELTPLFKLVNLRYLELLENSKEVAEQIDQLQKQLPECNIVRMFDFGGVFVSASAFDYIFRT